MGLGLAYTPTATHEEILDLFYAGGKVEAPRLRSRARCRNAAPGIFESLQEVIADSLASGASLHVVHIDSMAQKKTPEALAHDRRRPRPRPRRHH